MKFVYVQAVVGRSDMGCPGAISFRHTFVDASTEDEAYLLGERWADQFSYAPREETVNDYVVAAAQ